MRYSGRPGVAELSLVDIPPAGRLTTVAASLEGAVYGVLDLCRHQGNVEVDETRLASEGIVELHATWKDKGA